MIQLNESSVYSDRIFESMPGPLGEQQSYLSPHHTIKQLFATRTKYNTARATFRLLVTSLSTWCQCARSWNRTQRTSRRGIRRYGVWSRVAAEVRGSRWGSWSDIATARGGGPRGPDDPRSREGLGCCSGRTWLDSGERADRVRKPCGEDFASGVVSR